MRVAFGSGLVEADAERRNGRAERLHRRAVDERPHGAGGCGAGGDQQRHEVLVRAESAFGVWRELRVARELLEIRLAAHLKHETCANKTINLAYINFNVKNKLPVYTVVQNT